MRTAEIRAAVALLAAAGFFASPASADARGKVVDPDGKPVVGARACLMVGKDAATEGLCEATDPNGSYRLPARETSTVRIVAEGFLPMKVAAVEQEAPIVLGRAASIHVRVLDATTGSPIPLAQVRIVFATGEQKGPFPAKRGGVRVAKLPPGDVVPKATAEGYREGEGSPVALVGGRESKVELRLTPK
jgi:hypothetical protein